MMEIPFEHAAFSDGRRPDRETTFGPPGFPPPTR